MPLHWCGVLPPGVWTVFWASRPRSAGLDQSAGDQPATRPGGTGPPPAARHGRPASGDAWHRPGPLQLPALHVFCVETSKGSAHKHQKRTRGDKPWGVDGQLQHAPPAGASAFVLSRKAAATAAGLGRSEAKRQNEPPRRLSQRCRQNGCSSS